jgi:hypothetical protein
VRFERTSIVLATRSVEKEKGKCEKMEIERRNTVLGMRNGYRESFGRRIFGRERFGRKGFGTGIYERGRLGVRVAKMGAER